MKTTLFPSEQILIIDDEDNILNSMEISLRTGGINNIFCIKDSREVLPFLEENKVSIILLDLIMPHISGEKLLEEITRNYSDIFVCIVTGKNEIDLAVKCIKMGAYDYFVKPIDFNRLITVVKKAIQFRELTMEYSIIKERFLSDTLEHPEAFLNIVTVNGKMRSIFRYIEAIAHTSKPVLITGETGVGKELAAKSIHTLSGLKGDFISINVSGQNDSLFSDTLFGHEKGSYTGAIANREGLIKKAAGGTLFLDEIGDLSLESQAKLLRLLQEKTYYTLGSDLPRRSHARIIVATNRDLEELQKKDQFRQDLYFRLKTHHIHLPPLRERMDDLPYLVDHFLKKAAKELGKKKPTPPEELYILLRAYHFPGNIRELEAMIFDAVSSHKSKKLSMVAFKKAMVSNSTSGAPDNTDDFSFNGNTISISHKFPTLKQAEEFLIKEALQRTDNNQTIAARLLGISRQALNKRLRRSK